MRNIISVVAASTLLAALACAPEEIQVSCPRPESVEDTLKSAKMLPVFDSGGESGLYLVNIAPDSFWACAGIGEGDRITAFDSQTVSQGRDILELAEQIVRGAALELSVRDPSGNRRSVRVQ